MLYCLCSINLINKRKRALKMSNINNSNNVAHLLRHYKGHYGAEIVSYIADTNKPIKGWFKDQRGGQHRADLEFNLEQDYLTLRVHGQTFTSLSESLEYLQYTIGKSTRNTKIASNRVIGNLDIFGSVVVGDTTLAGIVDRQRKLGRVVGKRDEVGYRVTRPADPYEMPVKYVNLYKALGQEKVKALQSKHPTLQSDYRGNKDTDFNLQVFEFNSRYGVDIDPTVEGVLVG